MPTRHADPTGDRETQRLPADLLRYLPAQHRQIIVATYFRRRTTREAARLLGRSPEAVKAELYHAMRNLSDMLAANRSAHTGTRATPTRRRRLAAADELS